MAIKLGHHARVYFAYNILALRIYRDVEVYSKIAEREAKYPTKYSHARMSLILRALKQELTHFWHCVHFWRAELPVHEEFSYMKEPAGMMANLQTLGDIHHDLTERHKLRQATLLPGETALYDHTQYDQEQALFKLAAHGGVTWSMMRREKVMRTNSQQGLFGEISMKAMVNTMQKTYAAQIHVEPMVKGCYRFSLRPVMPGENRYHVSKHALLLAYAEELLACHSEHAFNYAQAMVYADKTVAMEQERIASSLFLTSQKVINLFD